MPRYKVALGVTISAYATTTIEAPTKKALIAMLANLIASDAGDLPFEVEWGTAEGYRVVEVIDAKEKRPLSEAEIDAINCQEPSIASAL